MNDNPTRQRDRAPILIDFPCDRMGIAAALRQAFTDAANDRSNHDFEKLLNQLN
ncbi:MAG: hypothetical protein M3Q57_07970 [Pseudomonadota bacterium]|nr:hypothetical protein [Pseudomonadota bacterium]